MTYPSYFSSDLEKTAVDPRLAATLIGAGLGAGGGALYDGGSLRSLLTGALLGGGAGYGVGSYMGNDTEKFVAPWETISPTATAKMQEPWTKEKEQLSWTANKPIEAVVPSQFKVWTDTIGDTMGETLRMSADGWSRIGDTLSMSADGLSRIYANAAGALGDYFAPDINDPKVLAQIAENNRRAQGILNMGTAPEVTGVLNNMLANVQEPSKKVAPESVPNSGGVNTPPSKKQLRKPPIKGYSNNVNPAY